MSHQIRSSKKKKKKKIIHLTVLRISSLVLRKFQNEKQIYFSWFELMNNIKFKISSNLKTKMKYEHPQCP